jgi:hypothetical protein
MKITDIKTLVVNAQLRNWVSVKVAAGRRDQLSRSAEAPLRTEVLGQMIFHPDGSVAEW